MDAADQRQQPDGAMRLSISSSPVTLRYRICTAAAGFLAGLAAAAIASRVLM
jgi:hypothetical protein